MYHIYMFNSMLILIINILLILISVAFLTLFERKLLSYIQDRKGPNKVFCMGLFQPFSDAIKLFTKENLMILKSNYYMYMISSMLMMLLMMMMWLIIPIYSNLYSMNLLFLYLFCIMSLSVYMMMISGWSSNSLYSLIGSLRSIAQTISYEVSFILILMIFLILNEELMIYNFYLYQKKLYFFFLLFIPSMMLMISMLAELNRTPFDLSEGESELVSGFNIEYMSVNFAIIFISEYGSIIFMSYLLTMLLMGGNFMNLIFYMKLMLFLFLIIWIRSTYPRYRYDNLMFLTWKYYLFNILMFLIIILLIKMILYYYYLIKL